MMRKICSFCWLLLALVCLPWTVSAAEAEENASKAKWTIMIYLCGSDLESGNAMATYNLQEISESVLPEGLAEHNAVNVLIETGGSKKWHAQESLGLDIAVDRLQRYSYNPSWKTEEGGQPFTLKEEPELRSMGEAGTLSDFILWCSREYPAEKYGLVLWDHGGGSRTGLFLDELFSNDILFLNELEQAMDEADVWMEAVAIDACMMGNLETAQALQHHASYMIGSEELVPGYGSAFKEWLTELYYNPDCTGEQFGRMFCDMTQRKYATMGDDQASSLLTFSVIDLSKLDPLSEYFDQFFRRFGEAYENDPELFVHLTGLLLTAEQYGLKNERMMDLGSVILNNDVSDTSLLELRNGMLRALQDVVIYMVRGGGRTRSNGLSFCCATAYTNEEKEAYASNCKSLPYLACLDAFSSWDAPEWVYEKEKKFQELDLDSVYNMRFKPVLEENGLPAVKVSEEDRDMYALAPYYELFQKDEATGLLKKLGKDICTSEVRDSEDGPETYFLTDNLSSWPAIEGELIDKEIRYARGEDTLLYDIPVQLGEKPSNLRMGCEFTETTVEQSDDSSGNLQQTAKEGLYYVYGLWDGYDEDTGMPGRNVQSLARIAGQEYQLIYPLYNEDFEKTENAFGEAKTMYRSMDIEEIPLPPGTYYIVYTLTDIFGRESPLPGVELTWDGTQFTVTDQVLF